MVDFLRGRMAPRDPKLPPENLYLSPQAKDFAEYTLLRNWMSNGVNTLNGTHLWLCHLMSPLTPSFKRQLSKTTG
jgi:hypothetical protein